MYQWINDCKLKRRMDMLTEPYRGCSDGHDTWIVYKISHTLPNSIISRDRIGLRWCVESKMNKCVSSKKPLGLEYWFSERLCTPYVWEMDFLFYFILITVIEGISECRYDLICMLCIGILFCVLLNWPVLGLVDMVMDDIIGPETLLCHHVLITLILI